MPEKGSGIDLIVDRGDRTIDDVLDTVAAHFEISREELVSGRTSRVSRHIATYLALKVTGPHRNRARNGP